jgi:PHD/YefM family antitoxin component YafN of YafNO toxin-antitoxin module
VLFSVPIEVSTVKTIPAQEIKRRGISALDDLLKDGPVHVIKNNRPCYVVLSEDDYARLTGRRGLWELADRAERGTRSKKDIDEQLGIERDAWSASR